MQLQWPVASTTAVQMVTPPSFTVTVVPGSAVPLIGGRWVAGLLPFAGPPITGRAGAVVSTVNDDATGALVLPEVSVAVAVMSCSPSDSGDVGVQVQVPLASAVVVQMV